jgi:hypothetical protein
MDKSCHTIEHIGIINNVTARSVDILSEHETLTQVETQSESCRAVSLPAVLSLAWIQLSSFPCVSLQNTTRYAYSFSYYNNVLLQGQRRLCLSGYFARLLDVRDTSQLECALGQLGLLVRPVSSRTVVLAVAHSLVAANVLCVGPMSGTDASVEGVLLFDQVLLSGIGDGHEAGVDRHSGVVGRGRDVVVLVANVSFRS